MTAIDPPESFPDDGAGYPPLAEPKAGHVRAASVEDLKTLLKALELEKVDYLLIGGYALYTLGYQRGTTDIDVLMRPTREQGERAQRASRANAHNAPCCSCPTKWRRIWIPIGSWRPKPFA